MSVVTSPDAAAAALRGTDFRGAIDANRRATTLLCLALIMIGGLLGYGIGWSAEVLAASNGLFTDPAGGTAYDDYTGTLSAWSRWGAYGGFAMLVFGALWTAVALTWGDRIVVAMAGGAAVTPEQEPVLHNVVEEIAIASGLPKPAVVVIETSALNAFATGLSPERATIGVTRGLLARLERDELQGVVAHEMAHIANDDVSYMTAVGVIVGLIVLVADLMLRMLRGVGRAGLRGKGGAVAVVAVVVFLLTAVLAPLAARLVQMAISRQREYLADATSVEFTRNPAGLIAALRKIDGSDDPMTDPNRAIQHLFISNPVKRFGRQAGALFATHPATDERIERLRNLG